MIFEGQYIGDPKLNYRLKKKIQHVSTQLHHMIKREKVASGGQPVAVSANGQPVKTVSLGTTLLMRHFDRIIQRFEEHDPVFHAVSRAKLEARH